MRSKAGGSMPDGDSIRGTIQRVFHAIGIILSVVLRITGIALGISFIILGLILAAGFIAGFTGDTGFFQLQGLDIHSPERLLQILLPEGSDSGTAVAGIIMFAGIPLLILIYAGMRLAFGNRARIEYLQPVMTSLWFAGLVICLVYAYQIVTDFRNQSSFERKSELQVPNNDTLFVSAVNGFARSGWDENHHSEAGSGLAKAEDEADLLLARSYCPSLEVAKSPNSSFYIDLATSARGRDALTARSRAESVSYDYYFKDSVLMMPLRLNPGAGQPYRKQSARLVIQVPVGKYVSLSDNTWIFFGWNEQRKDFGTDRSGKLWRMTADGLVESSSARENK
jgi:hypothetical protein